MTSTTLQLDYALLDVFTQTRYDGNPLAVVRVPKSCSLTQEQKQTIAREFNLSETTFLHENTSEAPLDPWTVDIFTTTEELPFAGHPTIGTACFVLSEIARRRSMEEGQVQAKLNLKAGPVDLRYDVARNTARAEIPHDVHIHKKMMLRDELLKLQPQLAERYQKGDVDIRDQFPIVSIVRGMAFVLIELESLEALGIIAKTGHRPSAEGLDEDWNRTFVGTYFYVKTGTSPDGVKLLRTRMIEGSLEDPATGSAASDLTAYLSLVEGGPKQTLKYTITQGVEMGRRSDIYVEVAMKEDRGIATLHLAGGAIQVMEGRLTI